MLFSDGSEGDGAPWPPPALLDGPEQDPTTGCWHDAGGTHRPLLKLPKHHAATCRPRRAAPAAPGARQRGPRAGWQRGMREPASRVPKRRACCYGNGSWRCGKRHILRRGQGRAAPGSTRPTRGCAAPSLPHRPRGEGGPAHGSQATHLSTPWGD